MHNSNQSRPKKRCIYTVQTDNDIKGDGKNVLNESANDDTYRNEMSEVTFKINKFKPKILCRRCAHKLVYFRPRRIDNEQSKEAAKENKKSEKWWKSFSFWREQSIFRRFISYIFQGEVLDVFKCFLLSITVWTLIGIAYFNYDDIFMNDNAYNVQEWSFTHFLPTLFEEPPQPKSWFTQALEYLELE